MAQDEDDRQQQRLKMEGRRQFDEVIADLRWEYHRLPPEERAKWRSWLEKANALDKEKPQSMQLVMDLSAEYELQDDDGNPVFHRRDFSVRTLLNAFKAWDEGGTYAPASDVLLL
jgi:hypothetical protein